MSEHETNYAYPKDGYRAVMHERKFSGRIAVCFQFTTGGKSRPGLVVLDEKATTENRGRAEQLFWLLQGVAHYMNSGGSLNEIKELVERLSVSFGGDDQLRPPEGYSLLSTKPDGDDYRRFEHIFVANNLDALVWTEDLELRRTNLLELNRELDEEAEADSECFSDIEDEE